MTKVWNDIPAAWKALAALAAAFLVGVAVSHRLNAQSLLPSQVQALTDTTRVHSTRIDAIERKQGQYEADMDRMICLQLSQLETTPWQRCLK